MTAVLHQVVHQFAGRGRAQDGRVVLLLKHHRLVADHNPITGVVVERVWGGGVSEDGRYGAYTECDIYLNFKRIENERMQLHVALNSAHLIRD